MEICVGSSRDDALLERSLSSLQNDCLADALVDAESVCRRHPNKVLPAVLRAKILQLSQPTLATKAWYLAWCRNPQDVKLQDSMLHAFLASGAVQTVRELGSLFLPLRCQSGDHGSLVTLLDHVDALPLGACWKEGDTLRGQLFFSAQSRPAHAQLQLSDEDLVCVVEVPADGSAFSVVCPQESGVWSLSLCIPDAIVKPVLLSGSPIVFAKNNQSGLACNHIDPIPLAERAVRYGIKNAQNSLPSVHIIIPVYGNFTLAKACISSVLVSLASNSTAVILTVVDDASTDVDLCNWLDDLSAHGSINLLRNRFNLGYIEACNRGLRHRQGRDALVLNADTMVHGNWVDRLFAALHRAPDIASVTPWSNNGEISSFPYISSPAATPSAVQLAQLDNAAAAAHDASEAHDVDLPACCGFAMLMRGKVLDDIGLLDGVQLIRGYNEEVDWCQRAVAAGYRHCLATAVFIAHAGTASFGYEKTLRVAQNRVVVQARYPNYYGHYQQFLQQDPAKSARAALLGSLEGAGNNWLHLAKGVGEKGAVIPQFFPPPLASACQRIAVWRYDNASRNAKKVLRLARLVASFSAGQPKVRLLVFGEASEALWRTGVVDVLPLATKRDRSLLSDPVLLGFCGCGVVLSETEQELPAGLTSVALDESFDPDTWLNQWLQQQMEWV